MCVGLPMRVVSVEGLMARCVAGEREEAVDLALTGPLDPGVHVLVFLGTARMVLDPEEAARITAALDGLGALMAGGSLGDAFADLDAREPALPPHLDAARRAGARIA